MVAPRNRSPSNFYDPTTPRSSINNPRAHLLRAVRKFVRRARKFDGVLRIALMGSLTTTKLSPKDADVLVIVPDDIDLGHLAKAARQLQGHAQSVNLGADIFLARTDDHYIGRICHWRECRPRVACRAQHCGRREHLNDDLNVVTLANEIVRHPPVDLWPEIVPRMALPKDVEDIVLAPLRSTLNGNADEES
jgi:hypothetical protein